MDLEQMNMPRLGAGLAHSLLLLPVLTRAHRRRVLRNPKIALVPVMLCVAACQLNSAGPRAPDAPAKIVAPITSQQPAASQPQVVAPAAHSITPVTDGASTASPPVTVVKKPVARAPAPKAPAAAPAVVAAPAPAKPASAEALDLAGLEQRLKDTRAIGVFTKLSLKNQVDDLLKQFRMFYSGQAKASLADLRQHYDLLLLKVLSLLQDADPPLASAISSSKEALWGILSDRDKFNKIESG
jgi:hypothetical protein